MDTILIVSLMMFAVIVGLMVWLRATTGNKYEIKNSDFIMGLLPVVLLLFLSGKIESFEFGGISVKNAFQQASQEEIISQIDLLSGLPVSELEPEIKGGVDKIRKMIENRTESLEFQLGNGGYDWVAIREYFETLRMYSLLKYVIVNNSDGTFFGLYDATRLVNFIEAEQLESRYRSFEEYLNNSDRESLKSLPGFIGSELSVKNSANKRIALGSMETNNLNFLPVVSALGKLEGIVERSRLTASLILDVAERLGESTESD